MGIFNAIAALLRLVLTLFVANEQARRETAAQDETEAHLEALDDRDKTAFAQRRRRDYLQHHGLPPSET